jgi:hypothetical protein
VQEIEKSVNHKEGPRKTNTAKFDKLKSANELLEKTFKGLPVL